MKKFITSILLAAAMLVPTGMDAATVKLRKGTLTVTQETTEGKVIIMFGKCMANQLYTFSSVAIDGVILNQTGSDNIGPFLSNGWWMGGNHTSASGAKTANTISYKIEVDGTDISDKGTTTAYTTEGDIVTVNVVNEIFYSDNKKFCDEIVDYIISGNSIEVKAHHDYTHSTLKVNRYYGMQSMFIGETEILTPGGNSPLWQKLTITSEGNEVQFTKKSAPNFCTYIEHSPNGYQASYMLREGLGNREWVADNDVVFIGNSWSKCYHKTIGDYNISEGMSSDWHGIYSWFKTPVADHCRKNSEDKTFSYIAYINGVRTLMTLQADGTMKTEEAAGVDNVTVDNDTPIASVANGAITVYTATGKCFDVAGKLVHEGAGSFNVPTGVYVVNDGVKSAKLFVK